MKDGQNIFATVGSNRVRLIVLNKIKYLYKLDKYVKIVKIIIFLSELLFYKYSELLFYKYQNYYFINKNLF